jgi:hypothetical protein
LVVDRSPATKVKSAAMYEIDQNYLETLSPTERSKIEMLYKLIVDAHSVVDEADRTNLMNEIRMLAGLALKEPLLAL